MFGAAARARRGWIFGMGTEAADPCTCACFPEVPLGFAGGAVSEEGRLMGIAMSFFVRVFWCSHRGERAPVVNTSLPRTKAAYEQQKNNAARLVLLSAGLPISLAGLFF